MRFGPLFDEETSTAPAGNVQNPVTSQVTGSPQETAQTPNTPAIPAGHKVVPESEYAEAVRWKETASKAGWKPEELSEYAELKASLAKAGRSPKEIAQLFGSRPEPKPEPKPTGFDPSQIETLLEQKLAAREEAKLRESYEKTSVDFERSVTDWVKSVVPDNDPEVPEGLVSVFRDAITYRVLDYRLNNVIKDGPLKGQPAASLTAEQLDEIKAMVAKSKDSLKGVKMSAVAKAAKTIVPASAKVTATGQQGHPQQPKPGYQPTREDYEQSVRRYLESARR